MEKDCRKKKEFIQMTIAVSKGRYIKAPTFLEKSFDSIEKVVFLKLVSSENFVFFLFQ